MSAIVNYNDWIINFSNQRRIWGAENRDATKTVASIKITTIKKKAARADNNIN